MDYQDLLECAICHELLCNPCTLACEHSFCKECIDHIAKFKENLITVTCSLCEVEQVIESGFGNLKPPLVLKQMLDRANRAKVTFKCVNDGCFRQASRYCVESACYLCEKCTENHVSLATQLTFISVKLSYWNNCMLPNCRQHDAFKEFYCLTCTKLCCKYCEHETHREHCTMSLKKYNQAKYEDNIIKEIEQMKNSKLELEVFQKDLKTKGSCGNTEEIEFLKSLTQRKNVVIAKCLHMIRDFENMCQENYRKIKTNYHEEISKKIVANQFVIDKCNVIFDQEEKFNEGSDLEKYHNFNQLLNDVRECNKSLEKVDKKVHFAMNLDQAYDKDDELLFHSLSESFGISLTLSETVNEIRDDLDISFAYRQNASFQNTLQNDDEVCSFIRTILDEELNISSFVTDKSSDEDSDDKDNESTRIIINENSVRRQNKKISHKQKEGKKGKVKGILGSQQNGLKETPDERRTEENTSPSQLQQHKITNTVESTTEYEPPRVLGVVTPKYEATAQINHQNLPGATPKPNIAACDTRKEVRKRNTGQNCNSGCAQQ